MNLFRTILLSLPVTLLAGNLEQLIQTGFTTEPIKASQANLDITKVQREALKDTYLPHLSIGGSATYNNEESFGNPRTNNMIYTRATANLYDGGKKWAYEDQYDEKIKARTLALQNDKNYHALQVIQAYYSILNIQEQRQAKGQEAEQLQAEIERFERFYEAGTITLDQVEKIRAAKAVNDAALSEINLNLQKARHNLEWLTGTASEIEIGSKLSEPDLQENANRADIASLQADVQAQHKEIDIAGADKRPQVHLEGTYSHSEYHYDNVNIDPKFPQDQGTVKVMVDWKVFDFGMTERKKEASRYGYVAAKEQFSFQERHAKLEFEDAKKALEIAQAKIQAAQARVSATDKTYELVKQKFHVNLVDNVAYLDALTQKYDAQANLQIAYNNYEIDKANYYYQAGIPLEEKIQ